MSLTIYSFYRTHLCERCHVCFTDKSGTTRFCPPCSAETFPERKRASNRRYARRAKAKRRATV